MFELLFYIVVVAFLVSLVMFVTGIVLKKKSLWLFSLFLMLLFTMIGIALSYFESDNKKKFRFKEY